MRFVHKYRIICVCLCVYVHVEQAVKLVSRLLGANAAELPRQLPTSARLAVKIAIVCSNEGFHVENKID